MRVRSPRGRAGLSAGVLLRSYVSVTVLIVVLTACSGGITRETSCADYLAYDNESRAQAVRVLGTEDDMQFAGNPMMFMSFDAACGQHPDWAVGDMIVNFAE